MKRSNFKRSMILPMLILAFPLFNAHASNGGVIHFQGQIVEGGCPLSNQEHSVTFSCTKNGKPVEHTVALTNLAGYTVNNDSPFSTRLQYLDAQRKLAVLEVTYR